MRVLGIDPAAAGPAGYGVVDADARNCRAVRFGALSRASRGRREEFPQRLRSIHSFIAALIEEFSPDVVAVESVFAALNMKTALKLAEVRGVILLAAAQAGIEVFSYAPREVKASVAGYGHAGKQQMQQMVRTLLSLRETPHPSDAADALAVALCHIYSVQSRARIATATSVNAARPERPAPASRDTRAAASRIQLPR